MRRLTLLILLLALGLTAPLHAELTFPRGELLLTTVDGQEHLIDVELAITREQRTHGLMFRETVPPGTGMLFHYQPPAWVVMWMKNTPASLDMLFADEAGVIFRIVERTTPYSLEHIPAGAPTSYVLELSAGAAERKGITPGAWLKLRDSSSPDE